MTGGAQMNGFIKSCFDAGFVIDGMEEPILPNREPQKPGLRWNDMTEIPPILVVRCKARSV